MEKFFELMDLAEKKLSIADHILTISYPSIKHPKLLLASAENLFLALSYSITSLLHYERRFKRIPPFSEDFRNRFEVFKDECAPRYSIQNEHIRIIQDLKEILMAHKQSPMEFSRKESFVICDEAFESKVITPDKMKSYLKKAKLFIKNLSTIVIS